MDKVNRGKDFEDQVRKGFESVLDLSIDRIPDQMSGKKGSSNICDFIIYRQPFQLYLECKCCYGNTLPFSNISDNQWKGLLKKSEITGVIAGVMIWFIDHDYTTFIPIQALQSHKEHGEKSVNISQISNNWKGGKLLPYGMNDITVPGEKKRIFFEYNMLAFLDYLFWLESCDPFETGERSMDYDF